MLMPMLSGPFRGLADSLCRLGEGDTPVLPFRGWGLTMNIQRNLWDYLRPRCTLQGLSGWEPGLHCPTGVMTVLTTGQLNWIAASKAPREQDPP